MWYIEVSNVIVLVRGTLLFSFHSMGRPKTLIPLIGQEFRTMLRVLIKLNKIRMYRLLFPFITRVLASDHSAMNTNLKQPGMTNYTLRESNPCLLHKKTMS